MRTGSNPAEATNTLSYRIIIVIIRTVYFEVLEILFHGQSEKVKSLFDERTNKHTVFGVTLFVGELHISPGMVIDYFAYRLEPRYCFRLFGCPHLTLLNTECLDAMIILLYKVFKDL